MTTTIQHHSQKVTNEAGCCKISKDITGNPLLTVETPKE